MGDLYVLCMWDSVNNINGCYQAYDDHDEAVAAWTASNPPAGYNCACWEALEANNYVYTQDQGNAYRWK